MSSIAPFRPPVLSPSNAAPTLGTATAAAAAMGGNVPAAIIQLGAGAVISGIVLEKGGRGQFVLRTDKGTLTIQTPLPLQIGATLTLQLQSVGAQVQLTILSIDGEPIPGPARPAQPAQPHPAAADGTTPARTTPHASLPPSPSAGQAPSASAAPAMPSRTDGLLAEGSAVRPASTGAGPVPVGTTGPTEAMSVFRPGAVLTGQIVAPAKPAQVPMQPSGTPARTVAASTSIPGPAAIPTPASAPSLPVQATTLPAFPVPQGAKLGVAAATAAPVPIQLRVLGMTAPVAASAVNAPSPMVSGAPNSIGLVLPHPPRITAEVPARSDAVTLMAVVMPAETDEPGATLLRTSLGIIRVPLPAAAALPPGTALLLEILPPLDVDGRPILPPLDAVDEIPRRLLSLGQEWPALRDTTAALQAADPAAAQRMMLAAIPRVGPGLAAGLLFFVAAMRNGDTRAWIGERAAESLDRAGHGALLSRLAEDVSIMPRLADSQPNGWQTLVMPLFDGERLQQIRMYMRRGRKADDGDRREGARFILEADLSKLGPLQLDGLVHPPLFDLAVRTRENLPPAIRADILQIFNDAMQATKLQGSVSFHTARDIRPGPFEDWQGSALGLTV